MDKVFYVYGLLHPITKELRYIGQTDSLTKRLKSHCSNNQLKKNNYKNNWIKSLLKNYLIPEIIILELHNTFESVLDAEIALIAKYKELVCRLTNSTAGGEGSIGYRHTPEALEKMSKAGIERVKNEPADKKAKRLEKLRLSNLGRKPADWNKTQKMSASKKSTGRKMPDTQRNSTKQRMIGENNPSFGKTFTKRKLTFDQANEIRELYKTEQYTYTDLSKKFNINVAALISIINNKTYLTSNINNSKRKLTFQQAEQIRNLYESGDYTITALSKMFNTSFIIISCIVKRISYLS